MVSRRCPQSGKPCEKKYALLSPSFFRSSKKKRGVPLTFARVGYGTFRSSGKVKCKVRHVHVTPDFHMSNSHQIFFPHAPPSLSPPPLSPASGSPARRAYRIAPTMRSTGLFVFLRQFGGALELGRGEGLWRGLASARREGFFWELGAGVLVRLVFWRNVGICAVYVSLYKGTVAE